MKNFFIWLSVTLILVILFHVIFPSLNTQNNGCREYKLMLKENISSVITKKYIDTVNHNFKTIEFFDIDGNKVDKILLEEYGKMYQIINVGDSLIKKPEDDMYTIISNGNFKRLRFNNFCKNKNQ
jgi:hypothetical protein